MVQRGIVNPKLQTVITPATGWDLYLDAGGGFHSNDARAVVAQDGVGALPRAWGAEVGTRLSLLDRRLDLAAAFWFIHLQSELVFVPDEGTTEASDPTDRYGVDLEVRFRILPWMWADADLTLAHAAYTKDQGNGSAVALAPTFTGQAGLSVLHPRAGAAGSACAGWGAAPPRRIRTGSRPRGTSSSTSRWRTAGGSSRSGWWWRTCSTRAGARRSSPTCPTSPDGTTPRSRARAWRTSTSPRGTRSTSAGRWRYYF